MIRPPQATVRSQLSQGKVPGRTVFLSSKPYAGRSIASQTLVQSFLPHNEGQQPLLIRRAYCTVRIAVSNLPFDADRRKTQPGRNDQERHLRRRGKRHFRTKVTDSTSSPRRSGKNSRCRPASTKSSKRSEERRVGKE